MVICGYDASTEHFTICDPASSLPSITISASALDTARCAFGTDEDLLLISTNHRPDWAQIEPWAVIPAATAAAQRAEHMTSAQYAYMQDDSCMVSRPSAVAFTDGSEVAEENRAPEGLLTQAPTESMAVRLHDKLSQCFAVAIDAAWHLPAAEAGQCVGTNHEVAC